MLGLVFGTPGWGELLILGALGLLIFGKRLPEVGKSLGRGIVEFKKGLTGIEDAVDGAGHPTRRGGPPSDRPPDDRGAAAGGDLHAGSSHQAAEDDGSSRAVSDPDPTDQKPGSTGAVS